MCTNQHVNLSMFVQYKCVGKMWTVFVLIVANDRNENQNYPLIWMY